MSVMSCSPTIELFFLPPRILPLSSRLLFLCISGKAVDGPRYEADLIFSPTKVYEVGSY